MVQSSPCLTQDGSHRVRELCVDGDGLLHCSTVVPRGCARLQAPAAGPVHSPRNTASPGSSSPTGPHDVVPVRSGHERADEEPV
jgi:hypothetical protein